MVENGVPHGDGLRRTHAGRWKRLRLVPFPDRSAWKTGKMSKNLHALDSGRRCCYNREGCEFGSAPGSTHIPEMLAELDAADVKMFSIYVNAGLGGLPQSTAMAILTLGTPHRFLPIYQR